MARDKHDSLRPQHLNLTCQLARPLACAGVEDNVMAVTDEGTGGGAAESVGGAGDEDAGHEMILPPVVCWCRSR